MTSTPGYETIVGIGSLLGEKSSRMTFPHLINFRLGRLKGFRRVFEHPVTDWFETGIANRETLECSGLTAERIEDGQTDEGFLVTVFEIPVSDLDAFYQREWEFEILKVPVTDMNGVSTEGLLCARASDKMLQDKWGMDEWHKKVTHRGIDTIWHWQGEIWPCRPYLRHCVLAARRLGPQVEADFLNHTYLYDRKTRLREYVERNAGLLDEEPIALYAERYGGG
ncbi:unnamed protein product [Vitrella brassicaformis CCMP3155]|uniref:Gamma-glutamylcyclotransferase AIG2-like domain-containing protein n=1 Tax=Vitrella brassicaformis (strain CCMP3155) TaxID=1169540 RepID=A0A0G4FXF8_VITBC|nr:unnamed protein product [Vitrella brassicaformis CCMP3155]|mmetsp:Transcript_3769/g.8599  ORF Transcript_3769/g.8599 Transcript_3769/m.8599 type:complete len:224 (-) Transcript_3769:558-1229(-)|eukprot:CEM20093.1 unnamed protein product [Vitrella brassicaformis CCMP3155]